MIGLRHVTKYRHFSSLESFLQELRVYAAFFYSYHESTFLTQMHNIFWADLRRSLINFRKHQFYNAYFCIELDT